MTCNIADGDQPIRSTGCRFAAHFSGLTYTFEDDRFSYIEQRFVTLGLLAGVPVSIVHTETANEIRIVSFRQATRSEAQLFFSAVTD